MCSIGCESSIFKWVIDLESAVAMFRDLDGTLHVRQDPELTTGKGVALGGLVGAFVAPSLAGALHRGCISSRCGSGARRRGGQAVSLAELRVRSMPRHGKRTTASVCEFNQRDRRND
jgi:hypothetical protein